MLFISMNGLAFKDIYAQLANWLHKNPALDTFAWVHLQNVDVCGEKDCDNFDTFLLWRLRDM
jgi:hypothetical protein